MHNKGGRKFSNKFVSKTEVSIETAITKLSKKYGSIDLLTAAIMRNNNLSYEKASEIAERLNSSDYLFDRLIDDMKKIYEFTPYCDDYDFTLEQGIDEEGDEYYHGIDIPCKDDPEWRFWSLYEDDCIGWNLSDEEIENIKEQVTKYCLENGYTYNGNYFE